MKYYFFIIVIINSLILSQTYTILNVYAVFTVEDEESENLGIPKIILTSQKYKSGKFLDEIVGQVKNIGNGTAEYVTIGFTLFNKKGEIIGSESIYIEQDKLKPGQKSSFSGQIDEKTGDKVKAYEVSLSWDNPDGTEEYIENVQIAEDDNQEVMQTDEDSKKLTKEEIEKRGFYER